MTRRVRIRRITAVTAAELKAVAAARAPGSGAALAGAGGAWQTLPNPGRGLPPGTAWDKAPNFMRLAPEKLFA